MEQIDVAVIGAGVSGLAAALAIASRRSTVCVIERHARPGLETSTHNSGVVHAGIYYPPGSLKARLSVAGRHQLYEFCRRHRVRHAPCGKLIVAQHEAEVPELERLRQRGIENGVERLELVDARFVTAREPAVRAVAALFSPETGIVSADELVRAIAARSKELGAILLPGTTVLRADRIAGGMRLQTGRESIHARMVVNAAGLYADEVSAMLGGERFTIYPCRGEYAALTHRRQSLVRGLVYPLPDATGHGLGVHLVPTVDGDVWLGPTVRYQDRKDDYEGNRLPVAAFLDPARRLLPSVTLEDLQLSGSGIRAKLHPPHESFADFMIRRDCENSAVVQVAGIDSPGLTSCLAVGELVSSIVADAL